MKIDAIDTHEAPRLRRVDPQLAHLVATAFVAASSAPTDPTVRAAYADLSNQAGLWFARLTSDRIRRPVRVAFTRCHEPYADAPELSESVRRHRVLEIPAARHDRHRRHPLLDTSIGGAYDRLRAVHDIVSHGFLQYPFDRHGEFSAWRAEHRLYTGPARWALATELHGEHSVLWTSGQLADHKAILLEPGLLNAALLGPPVEHGSEASARSTPDSADAPAAIWWRGLGHNQEGVHHEIRRHQRYRAHRLEGRQQTP